MKSNFWKRSKKKKFFSVVLTTFRAKLFISKTKTKFTFESIFSKTDNLLFRWQKWLSFWKRDKKKIQNVFVLQQNLSSANFNKKIFYFTKNIDKYCFNKNLFIYLKKECKFSEKMILNQFSITNVFMIEIERRIFMLTIHNSFQKKRRF